MQIVLAHSVHTTINLPSACTSYSSCRPLCEQMMRLLKHYSHYCNLISAARDPTSRVADQSAPRTHSGRSGNNSQPRWWRRAGRKWRHWMAAPTTTPVSSFERERWRNRSPELHYLDSFRYIRRVLVIVLTACMKRKFVKFFTIYVKYGCVRNIVHFKRVIHNVCIHIQAVAANAASTPCSSVIQHNGMEERYSHYNVKRNPNTIQCLHPKASLLGFSVHSIQLVCLFTCTCTCTFMQ